VKLWLDLKSVNPENTEIWIRVGYWGDEQRARDVIEKIQKHLSM